MQTGRAVLWGRILANSTLFDEDRQKPDELSTSQTDRSQVR